MICHLRKGFLNEKAPVTMSQGPVIKVLQHLLTIRNNVINT